MKEPKIMGIVNLTPNSFYDGGQNLLNDYFLVKAEALVANGAKILDLGAVSTKPGSKLISPKEEWEILERPLRMLRDQFPDILFSVDTYNASTAQKSADYGVEMINDISGGTIDPAIFDVIAKNKLTYVLMHMHGVPESMQKSPASGNILEIISVFFEQQLNKLQEKGVGNIVLDPGFGFGKTMDQNYQLLKHLDDIQQFNLPILAGVSRKSMIFRFLKTNPDKALNGTTVLNTFALLNGAKILRVHDASEANETIKLFLKYKEF
ncbi:MAG: dihydropteroate synthase [Bacteroidales bacterium]|nr:dihydropteroate synthase [Bacteroidales bacterium]